MATPQPPTRSQTFASLIVIVGWWSSASHNFAIELMSSEAALNDDRLVRRSLALDDSCALRTRRTRRNDRHVEAARGEQTPGEARREAGKLATKVIIKL